MTRKRTHAKPRHSTAGPRPRRAPRAAPWLAGARPRWVGLALVLAAAAATWWWTARPPFAAWRSGGGVRSSPEVESLAVLGPQALHRRAVELGHSGRHEQSLPFYRRALEVPGTSWNLLYNYGSALQNAAIQVRPHLGRVEPVMRSSFERVRMMREALAQFDRVAALKPAVADRAFLIAGRGHLLATAGLPWDALLEFRRAQALAPGWEATADGIARSLRDPCGPPPGRPGP